MLFPYARARVRGFLEEHAADPDVRADVARLREEYAAEAPNQLGLPPWSVVEYVYWLMDRDRKSTGLKSLQGRIWEAGYRAGDFRGPVYPDVPAALARWRGQGRDIAIFSSGSVPAQQCLFASSTAGDLTPFIRAYFDTTTGPKTEARSYERIAAALERSPSEILFLSDVSAELDAARIAGMRTALCARTGEEAASAGGHSIVRTFDEV